MIEAHGYAKRTKMHGKISNMTVARIAIAYLLFVSPMGVDQLGDVLVFSSTPRLFGHERGLTEVTIENNEPWICTFFPSFPSCKRN